MLKVKTHWESCLLLLSIAMYERWNPNMQKLPISQVEYSISLTYHWFSFIDLCPIIRQKCRSPDTGTYSGRIPNNTFYRLAKIGWQSLTWSKMKWESFRLISLRPPLLKPPYTEFCFTGGNSAVCLSEPGLQLFQTRYLLSQPFILRLTLSKIYRGLFYQFNLWFMLIFSL